MVSCHRTHFFVLGIGQALISMASKHVSKVGKKGRGQRYNTQKKRLAHRVVSRRQCHQKVGGVQYVNSRNVTCFAGKRTLVSIYWGTLFSGPSSLLLHLSAARLALWKGRVRSICSQGELGRGVIGADIMRDFTHHSTSGLRRTSEVAFRTIKVAKGNDKTNDKLNQSQRSLPRERRYCIRIYQAPPPSIMPVSE